MEVLSKLNPHIKYIPFNERLTQKNIFSIISQFDVVIDGCDNALTRYLVNDCCLVLNKPLISGASVKWEGQVTIYNKGDGPCYRCLYPECPQPKVMMSCSANGVFGPAPGIIGMILASECGKLIVGCSELLVKKLLLVDLLNLRFKVVKVRGRKKDCFCQQEGLNKESVMNFKYDEFTGTNLCQIKSQIKSEWNLKWEEVLKKEESPSSPKYLLDVRPKGHRKMVNLLDDDDQFKSENIELNELLANDISELDNKLPKDTTIYVYCRSGVTSQTATVHLREHGYDSMNIEGGILELLRINGVDSKFINNL